MYSRKLELHTFNIKHLVDTEESEKGNDNMIVDVHTHVWEHPKHISDFFLNTQCVDVDRISKLNNENYRFKLSVDLKKHIDAMKPVDKAIVLGFKTKYLGVDVPNEYVADYVGRYKEKLIGFASVDPNDPDSLEELELAIGNLGLKGVKLSPFYQDYDLMSQKSIKLLRLIKTQKVPILWHLGPDAIAKCHLRYCDINAFDEIAIMFPEIKMVIAHLANPWIDEGILLIRKHKNVFADMTGLNLRSYFFYETMMKVYEYGAMDKILFGSDYPYSTPEIMINSLLNINKIVRKSGLPKIPISEIEKVINRDTLKLLDLS